jgi:hypothetical protein
MQLVRIKSRVETTVTIISRCIDKKQEKTIIDDMIESMDNCQFLSSIQKARRKHE